MMNRGKGEYMVEIIAYILSLLFIANSPVNEQPVNPSPLEAYSTYVNEHYKEALENDIVLFYYEDITHDGIKDMIFCDRRYFDDSEDVFINVYLLTLSDTNQVNCFFIDEYRSIWRTSYYLVDYQGKRCILKYATGHFGGTNMTRITDYQYEIYYYNEEGKKVFCEREQDTQRLYYNSVLPEDPVIIEELRKFQEMVESKKKHAVELLECHFKW